MRLIPPPPQRLPRSPLLALIAAALFAFCGPSNALGAVGTWSGSAPRAKGIEAIVHDPLNPQRLWAAAFGSGVWRSLDGGATWTPFRSGLVNTFVRCLAVQPHHPDSLYCGTNDGIFLSVDGGVNWTRLLSSNASVRSIAIHPIRTGVLYAAEYGNGVFKSLNGGQNWSQIDLGLTNVNVRDVEPNPARPETLLAATGTGGGIHLSLNGGLSWTQVADTTANRGAVEQIQWDRLDPWRAYAATLDRGVIKSVDGGVNWVRINRGLSSFRTRSLALVDSLRYVGTDGAGVFITTLNDTLWRPAGAGLTSLVVDGLMTLPTLPATIWAGTDGGGIFVSGDRGTSWTQLDGGLLATCAFSLAVRPSNHEVYDGAGFGDQFWRSSDRGASWSRAGYLFTHDSEHGVVPDPVLPATVYLSAYGAGVFRSDDDGLTWSNPDSLNLTLGNHFVRDLVAWPGQSGHLFVGTGIGPFESLDGGAHWTPRTGNLPASLAVHALALVPGAPATLYVGSDSTGVWRSTDGGSTWLHKNAGLLSPFVHALVVDAASPAVVYAATDSGVFRTVNGGDLWTAARAGLPAGIEARALVQDGVHGGVLFCGLYGGGVFRSMNGGASWTPVAGQAGLPSLAVRSLALDPGLLTIYAGTDNGVAALTEYAALAVPGPGSGEPLLALAVSPNPAPAGVLRVRCDLPRPGRVRIDLYDVTGARLRTLEDRELPAGRLDVAWDGRDATGRAVPAGLYFARLVSPQGTRTARAVLLGR